LKWLAYRRAKLSSIQPSQAGLAREAAASFSLRSDVCRCPLFASIALLIAAATTSLENVRLIYSILSASKGVIALFVPSPVDFSYVIRTQQLQLSWWLLLQLSWRHSFLHLHPFRFVTYWGGIEPLLAISTPESPWLLMSFIQSMSDKSFRLFIIIIIIIAIYRCNMLIQD